MFGNQYKTQKSNLIPISLQAGLLEEIAEEIDSNEEEKQQTTSYINQIYEMISQFNSTFELQKKTERVDYASLKNYISEIEQIANSLYNVNKYANAALANSLKRIIIESIKIPKKLLIDEFFKLENKPNPIDIYEDQLSVITSSIAEKKLEEHLQAINIFLNGAYPTAQCCFCYTSPTKMNQLQEKRVISFLTTLYDHLQIAGIKPLMDIKDLHPGDNPISYNQQYKSGNPILLFLTDSLKEICDGDAGHIIKEQVSIAVNQFDRYGNNILPILLSNNLANSLPEICENLKSSTYYPKSYLGLLKDTISIIYKNKLDNTRNETYQHKWDAFINAVANSNFIKP